MKGTRLGQNQGSSYVVANGSWASVYNVNSWILYAHLHVEEVVPVIFVIKGYCVKVYTEWWFEQYFLLHLIWKRINIF